MANQSGRVKLRSEQDKHLDKTYGKSGQSLGVDIGRSADNWGNSINQGVRSLGEFLSGIGKYLNNGQDLPSWAPSAMMAATKARSIQKPSDALDYVPDESSRRASVQARLNRRTPGYGRKEDTGLVDQFAKYLSQAEGFVPGESDWGGLEASLRSRAGEHDAKLEAMYRQLRSAIQADAPGIAANYDQGVSAIDESAQQATQAITQGYDAARQAQTSSLAALGIEDAAASLVSDGGGVDFAAQNQGQATEQVANTNQTNEDALTKDKAASLNYNTGMGNVAQLEGVESRGQLQNSLTDALTEMAFAQSQESKQRQASIYEVAMKLQSDAQQGLEPDPEMIQALAEFNAKQQQLSFENALSGKKANSNVMLSLLKQTGGDQEKANQIYAEWQAAGIV